MRGYVVFCSERKFKEFPLGIFVRSGEGCFKLDHYGIVRGFEEDNVDELPYAPTHCFQEMFIQ